MAIVALIFDLLYHLPYPLECNPGVLLIFLVFRPRTVVYFGEKSAKITVFLADFSSKLTIVRPNLSSGVLIKSDVLFARIRYLWRLLKESL